jgi:hypothetical protein
MTYAVENASSKDIRNQFYIKPSKQDKIITKLERCTVWSTLKFQRCSLRHITDDVSRETKGITNATVVSKVTVVSKAIVAAVVSRVAVATI